MVVDCAQEIEHYVMDGRLAKVVGRHEMTKGGLFGSSYNALSAMKQQPQKQQHNALEGLRQQPTPTSPPQSPYGNRVDGTPKGRGYLGEIKTPDGRVMTEYSIGVDWGDGEQEIPTVVPGLTKEEIVHLARGGEPTPSIIDRAIEHALRRIEMGLSPFAMQGVDY